MISEIRSQNTQQKLAKQRALKSVDAYDPHIGFKSIDCCILRFWGCSLRLERRWSLDGLHGAHDGVSNMRGASKRAGQHFTCAWRLQIGSLFAIYMLITYCYLKIVLVAQRNPNPGAWLWISMFFVLFVVPDCGAEIGTVLQCVLMRIHRLQRCITSKHVAKVRHWLVHNIVDKIVQDVVHELQQRHWAVLGPIEDLRKAKNTSTRQKHMNDWKNLGGAHVCAGPPIHEQGRISCGHRFFHSAGGTWAATLGHRTRDSCRVLS